MCNLIKSTIFLPYYIYSSIYWKSSELRAGMNRHSFAKLEALRRAGLSNEGFCVMHDALQRLHKDYGFWGR